VEVSTPLEFKPELLEIIREELNVKQVKVELAGEAAELKAEMDLKLTPELKREGLARELIRHIQNARKQAGLNVDDRINLKIGSESAEIMKAFEEFKDEIYRDTLATGELGGEGHHQKIELEGQSAEISLAKAS
jgi:isoleucyl-tRNA synthetase